MTSPQKYMACDAPVLIPVGLSNTTYLIEPFCVLLQHPLHSLHRKRLLIPRLTGREHAQSLHLLVGYQRLGQRALLLEDVDEVEDDPTLDAEVYVEVAQSDVEIDDAGGMAAAG